MRGWGMMRMEGIWRGDVHEGEGRLREGERGKSASASA